MFILPFPVFLTVSMSCLFYHFLYSLLFPCNVYSITFCIPYCFHVLFILPLSVFLTVSMSCLFYHFLYSLLFPCHVYSTIYCFHVMFIVPICFYHLCVMSIVPSHVMLPCLLMQLMPFLSYTCFSVWSKDFFGFSNWTCYVLKSCQWKLSLIYYV